MGAGPPGATLKDIGIHYKKRKQCARSQASSSTPGIGITVFTSPSWLYTKPYLCILPAGSRDGLSLFFKALPELWSQFLQRVHLPSPSPLCCPHHPLPVQARCDSVMKAQTAACSAYLHLQQPAASCSPENLGLLATMLFSHAFTDDFILPKCLFLVPVLFHLSLHVT